MSLLIDRDFVTQADMLAIDAEVADVADAESLIVEGDGSIARQNWDECVDVLTDAVQAFGGDIIAWPGTLTTYGAFGISRPRLRPNQIVIQTPYQHRQSPLKKWMLYRGLEMFYRAAARRREKDRYDRKWADFRTEAKRHWKTLCGVGIPMVALPLACPGSLHELRSGGPWAGVTAVAGGTGGAASYDVAIAWVDGTVYASPTNTQNAESGPSDKVTVAVATNQVLQVSIAGLNPPSSQSAMLQRGIADGPYITRSASDWNVYAAPSGNWPLTLQNATPLPISQAVFTFSGAPTTTGAAMLDGQFPDANYTFQRMLQRG